jgi:hypothetical protein
MQQRISSYWGSAAVVVGILAGLLVWPTSGSAQTVTGQAAAVRTTVLGLFGGTSTALADTGTLGSATDARDASQLTGNVPTLLTGETLHATAIGLSDAVASEASLAGLALSVAGTGIGADFIKAEAYAVQNGVGVGSSYLTNLSINGVPIGVSGAPNQTISIPGGQVVINEQISSAGGIVVNALHVIVNGVADVVIGSATAGM